MKIARQPHYTIADLTSVERLLEEDWKIWKRENTLFYLIRFV